MVFLALHTYMCLVRTPSAPSFPEAYVASCVLAFALELLRTFLLTESATGGAEKVRVWVNANRWRFFDSVAIVIFAVAFTLRFDPVMIPVAHAVYGTGVCYW